ncbi:MAG: hypothetical protein ABW170_00075 [Candidatus Thiodiazotropha sp. L084R]
MPYIAPYRSQLRPYNHAYAYRGLTAFATLSMAVSECNQKGGYHQYQVVLFHYRLLIYRVVSSTRVLC